MKVRQILNNENIKLNIVNFVPISSLFKTFSLGTAERQRFNAMKKMQSIERHRYENTLYANEEEDNIVFEDFARLRMNEPE